MAHSTSLRRLAPAAAKMPYLHGDRAPVPEAVEDDSETAWKLFEEEHTRQEMRFAETELMPTGKQAPVLKPFRPAKPVMLALEASLDEVIALTRRNNRVCPLPEHWRKLHHILLEQRREGDPMGPPPPMIGAVWDTTTGMPKRIAMREQLDWADRQGLLGAAYDFLRNLPEEHWFHMGD